MANIKIINVRIKGKQRAFARINKIIANIPIEGVKTIDKAMQEGRKVAQQAIRSKTEGTGLLADSLVIKKTPLQKGKNKRFSWTLDVSEPAKRYASSVDNGFTSHWVHKDMLGAWLAKHPDVKLKSGQWLEVGLPKTTTRQDGSPKQTASWITEGGVKFTDKAYAKILNLTVPELRKRVKKIVGG